MYYGRYLTLHKDKKLPEPLNFNLLREITDGDKELESQLLTLYFKTVDRCISQMLALIDIDPEKKWHRSVHELKGASANIYADNIAAICKQIEHLPEDPDERRRACEIIKEAQEELKKFISKLPL